MLYYGSGNSATPLSIGSCNSTTAFMNGGIDELQIWDRALSDAEIRLLANEKTLAEVDYILQPTEKYRYGYQGQFAERDEETGWNHFELREYDPIIGRWTSTDPAGQFFSPFVGMGNNPVSGADPDGAWVKGAGLWTNLFKSDDRIHSERIAEERNNSTASLATHMTYWAQKDGEAWGVWGTDDGYYTNGLITTTYTPVSSDGTIGSSEVYHTFKGPAPGNIDFDPAGQLMLAELGTAVFRGVGAFVSGYSGATTVAAKGGGRVFWSGGEEAMKAAANYAKANGGKTLEMTLGGRVMTTLNPVLPRSISSPIWNSLSTNFAKGATGSVNVFHNVNGVRLQSIWAQTEYGILRGNNVNIFYHNVFP